MTYQVVYHKKVMKFLEICESHIALKFLESVEIMMSDPHDHRIDSKALVWKPWHFRMRIGKYRFLYTIMQEKILIYFYDAWSRWDIYKS